jgi:hypothetical protein
MRMKSTTTKIVEQKGQAGLYASITLSAELRLGMASVVQYDPSIDDKWKTAIEFAVAYCTEQLPSEVRQNNVLSVRVEDLHWMPVDSTLAVVALVTIRCIWESIGFVPGEAPSLDPITLSVLLPTRPK